MKPVNYVKFTFLSRSINESFARGAIAAFAAQLDPTVEQLADIKTAVSEAVTNCIVHAYPADVGQIQITAAVYENERLVITITDKGVGIADVEAARQPMFTTGGAERAGLGFAVMESFMDNVKVRSKLGKGTRVTLIKQLHMREHTSRPLFCAA
ncbi:MAG: anti-sigma F factor [Oscillospiraceae bacterium]|nr:anti-sigma F factor [Oscillospiraceae bacterium]